MDRQKLLMIFGGALLCAALLTWFLYAKTMAPQKEKMVKVVAATRDLPAGTRLQKGDLKKVSIPEKDLPRAVVVDDKLAVDRALIYPVSANEPLASTRLASQGGPEGVSALIEPGKRAISVTITDASGVAGLIQPRAHVDVLFTRTGSLTEAVTTTILEDVTVLSMGRVTEIQTQSATTAAPTSASRAATLLVTPEQTRKLEWAKNLGKISLALRNPLDSSRAAEGEDVSVTAESIDPMFYGRTPRRGLKGKPGINLRDSKAWASLVGDDPPPPKPAPKPPEKKEPPKPRAVVDVFRGDKHVQEIFQ